MFESPANRLWNVGRKVYSAVVKADIAAFSEQRMPSLRGRTRAVMVAVTICVAFAAIGAPRRGLTEPRCLDVGTEFLAMKVDRRMVNID